MFLSSADGMSANVLSCLKGVKDNFGVKDTFGVQEGRWDFSRDAEAEKGHSSH